MPRTIAPTAHFHCCSIAVHTAMTMPSRYCCFTCTYSTILLLILRGIFSPSRRVVKLPLATFLTTADSRNVRDTPDRSRSINSSSSRSFYYILLLYEMLNNNRTMQIPPQENMCAGAVSYRSYKSHAADTIYRSTVVNWADRIVQGPERATS